MKNNQKEQAIQYYVNKLIQVFGNRIYKIILFGSVARGNYHNKSDIDILVILDKIEDNDHKIVIEIGSEIYTKFNESIETILYTFDEYLSKLSDELSIFIKNIERNGKVLYLNNNFVIERIRKLVELSNEYFKGAQLLFEQGFYRLAIDLCYNAIELLIKALILLKKQELPKTHSGYIYMFHELYIKSGEIDQEKISLLGKAFHLRNKARYEPDTTFLPHDVEMLLHLYNQIREFFNKKFSLSKVHH